MGLSMAVLSGIYEKIGVGMTMARSWSDPPMQILYALAGGLIVTGFGEYYIATRVGVAYMALPPLAMYLYYQFVFLNTPPADTEKYLEFKARAPPLSGARPQAPSMLRAALLPAPPATRGTSPRPRRGTLPPQPGAVRPSARRGHTGTAGIARWSPPPWAPEPLPLLQPAPTAMRTRHRSSCSPGSARP